MATRDVLIDAFGRILDDFGSAITGLSPDQLADRLDAGANSIAWLAWHAARVQDDHVAELAGRGQAWTEEGYHDRFDLGLGPTDIGYGHSSDEVAAVRVEDPQLLVDYLDAVTGRTREYLAGVDAAELDRVIDRTWDPPVTVAVFAVLLIKCDYHGSLRAYLND